MPKFKVTKVWLVEAEDEVSASKNILEGALVEIKTEKDTRRMFKAVIELPDLDDTYSSTDIADCIMEGISRNRLCVDDPIITIDEVRN